MYCLTYFVENRDMLGYFFSVPVVVVMQEERECVCEGEGEGEGEYENARCFFCTRLYEDEQGYYCFLLYSIFIFREEYLPAERRKADRSIETVFGE